MRRCHWFLGLWLVLMLCGIGQHAAADSFGSGANQFTIDFVTIGQPGNPRDPSGGGLGSVPYVYRIGKYEVPEDAVRKANVQSALEGQPLGITLDTRGPDKPATSVDWFEIARFVNWLNMSTGHTPAYKFDASGNFQLWEPGDPGYDPNNLFRNTMASYFLPSVDEWYKTAYYDPVAGHYWDYPTGSDAPPIAVASGTTPDTAVYHQDFFAGPAEIMQAGGLSPYGTVAQGGNVDEWEETELDRTNDELIDYRARRGGNWDSFSFGLSVSAQAGGFPSQSHNGIGFRVASIVPEPSAASLGLTLVLIVALTHRGEMRKWRSYSVCRNS